MKKVFIVSWFFISFSFAGVTSDTQMHIATEALPKLIDAQMKSLISQADNLSKDYKDSVLKNTQDKNNKLNQIKTLETEILIELENIKFNQEKINQIEVLK